MHWFFLRHTNDSPFMLGRYQVTVIWSNFQYYVKASNYPLKRIIHEASLRERHSLAPPLTVSEQKTKLCCNPIMFIEFSPESLVNKTKESDAFLTQPHSNKFYCNPFQ